MKIPQSILFILLILCTNCNSTKKLFSSKNITKLIDSSPNGKQFVTADNNGNLKVLISENNALLRKIRRKGGLFITALRFMTNEMILVGYEDGQLFRWSIKNNTWHQIKFPRVMKSINSLSFSWDKKTNQHFKDSLSKEHIYIATNKCIIGLNATYFLEDPIKNKIDLRRKKVFFTEEIRKNTRIRAFAAKDLFFINQRSLFNRKLNIQQDYAEEISKKEKISIYDISLDKKYVIFSKKNTPYLLPILRKTSKKIEGLQHNDDIIDIVFATDIHVFTASIDGTIKLWNIQSEQLIVTFKYPKEKIFDIDYNQGKLFIAGTHPSQRVVPIAPFFLMLDQLEVKLDLDKTVENQNKCYLKVNVKTPLNQFNVAKDQFLINDLQLYPNSKTIQPRNSSTQTPFRVNDFIPISFDIKDYSNKDTLTVCLGCAQLEKYKNDHMDKIVDINSDYFKQKVLFNLNSQGDETIYPLIIGPKLNDLKYNQKDAEVFNEILADQEQVLIRQLSKKKNYRRKIISQSNQSLIRQITLDDIDQSIKSIGSKIQEDDTFILFCSSHGIPHPNEHDKDVLIKIQNNDQYYSFRQLFLKILKEVKCKKIIIVLDACYSGRAINTVKGLTNNSSQQTIVVLTSSSESQTSIEGENFKQGVFTKFLLKGISNGDTNQDKKITFNELFESIQKGLIKADYRQKPQIGIFPKYKKKSEVFIYLN